MVMSNKPIARILSSPVKPAAYLSLLVKVDLGNNIKLHIKLL